MSDLNNFLNNGGDAALRRVNSQAESAGSLFADATWAQVGQDKKLTDFLHQSLDPNGSKYGGDSDALKEDLLNTTTAKGSSVLASIWDFAKSNGEGTQTKRFQNLITRLYEDAPNRLLSGDLNQTYQAVKSGLLGGALYDAPLLVATAGVGNLAGLGTKGLAAAGRAALGESAVKLAATDLGTEAAASIGNRLVMDTAITGAKRGAVREGAENAAFGVVGDMAQQGAGMNRGTQDEFNTGQLVTAALLGGGIGAAAGAVGGAREGYVLGKELKTELPSAAAGRVFDAEAASLAVPKTESPDANFLTPADAFREAQGNLASAADDISGFYNRVVSGDAKSRYTPVQIDAIKGALVEASTANRMSDALKSQADALRASPTPTPEAILKAAELEQQATAYESMIKFVQSKGDDFLHPGASLSNGDISPELVNGLAGYNRKLAVALGQADDTIVPTRQAARTAPAPANNAAPATNSVAQGSVATPAAGQAADAPTPTQEAAAAPAPTPPGTPTAQDVATMAETKFSEQEKAAYSTLNEMLGKSSMDLQAALDSMAANGQSQVVADVAKASGTDRAAVQEALSTVTGATQREYSKAMADYDTAVAAASKASAEKAGSSPAPVNSASPATENVAPVVTADELAAVKSAAESIDQKIVELKDSLPEAKSELQYEKMKANLDGQIADISAALDRGLADIESAVAAAVDGGKIDKASLIDAALKKAAEDSPDIAPLLAELNPAKMTTKKGIEAAKTKLRTLANDSISWTYAKAIGDILPDSLNFEHFDTVLRAVLSKAPGEEVGRISDAYRGFVREALAERIEQIGIDNVMKDPKLGPAWQRIINGEGGHQRFGGLSPAVSTGALIEHQASMVLAAIGGAPITRQQIVQVGGIVRDFRRQLRASGIPLDSKLMSDALAARALSATEYVLSGKFREDNAGDFEKLSKLFDLRKADRTNNETQSLNLHRMQGSVIGNPIVHRIYNESGEGDWYSRVVMASGRKQSRTASGASTLNGPQGILSDGISDYLGTLWAHPRKMFAAAANARNAIYGAAVDTASWSKGSMVIGGKKFSETMKELKGRMKERANEIMEQSRFANIVDAVERTKIAEGEARYLSPEAYKKQIYLISGQSRPVTEDEISVAQMLIDSRDRAMHNKEVARATMAEILAANKDIGESAADQINAVVARLDRVLKVNSDSAVTVLRENKWLPIDDATSSRRKTSGGAAKVSSSSGLTVGKDNVVAYGTRDVNPVTVKVKGENYEFVPKEAIALKPSGEVTLFGRNIGQWLPVEGKARSVTVSVKGLADGGEVVSDLSSLAVRKKFIEAHADLFDANAKSMTPAADAAASLPEGAQIDVSMSNTQAVKEAQKELLQPGKLSEADLARPMSSFDVPADSILVMKSASTPDAKAPGPLQGNMTVRDFARLVGIAPEDVRLGTIKQTELKNGNLRGKSTQEKLNYPGLWTPLGRDTGNVDQAIVEKVARRKENTPLMAQAQKRAISMTEADKIIVDGSGVTLGDYIRSFEMSTASLQYNQIGDISAYNRLTGEMQEAASIIESLAPFGVRKSNASRATSFHWLQDRMASFSEGERSMALDVLRRLDSEARGLPRFQNPEYLNGMDANAFWLKDGNSGIILSGKADGGTPKHVAVIHEVGHWAFTNMLSPSEQVAFIQSFGKHFDESGKLSMKSVMESMSNATALEKALGGKLSDLRTNTNELFAWQFVNHVMDSMVGGAGKAAESSLWDRVVRIGKNLLSYFLGQKIDPDLAPLFERILPSTISETKFNYGRLLDKKTGKVVNVKDLPPSASKVGQITDAMEKIDTLRGRIRQHLFVPGAVADAGFTADLKAANNHMLGLLYGRDANGWVGSLRNKLNPIQATGEWLRDAAGKVVKVDGKGVRAPVYREGMIDPRNLFNRTEYGKLAQAINDVLPDGKGDGVAFEAMAGAEESMAVLRSTSIGDNPEVAYTYSQAYSQELARLLKAGTKESEAIEKADVFALNEAAGYAMDTFGLDITDNVFDGNARVKLGTDQQREALGSMARNLHDLMGDAIDYLETEVERAGLALTKVKREVQPPEPSVSKAAEAKVAATSKKRKPKPAPATETGAKVAAAEESARVDGVQTGVPVAADPQVKALVARVPHRDPDQAGIIGAAMDRLLAFVVREEVGVTNADIARITGIPLEDGVRAEAMVSSTTEAFDALRKGLRLMSEELTNSAKKPKEAMDFISDMLIRDRMEAISNDLGPDILYGEKMVPLDSSFVRSQLVRFIRGEPVDGMLSSHLEGIYADTKHVLSGLGVTAEAKRAVGETVSTGSPVALRLADGTYHPALVRAGVTHRLQNLPKAVASALIKSIGVKEGNDVAGSLAKNVAYRVKGSNKVYTTVDEMLATASELSGLQDEHIRNLNGELAKAYSRGDMDMAQRMVDWYEANANAAGVTPVMVNMDRIYDPMMATDVQKLALQNAMESGKFKTQQTALKSLGFDGVQEGEQIKLFSQKSARDMEEAISKAVSEAPAAALVPDAPLVGELILNYGVVPDLPANPLAVEQRAIQAGAPAEVASIFSNPFKRGWSKEPLSDDAAAKVRSFHGVQLRSNPSRILRAGGEWLANKMAPINGTGFEEARMTKLGQILLPLVTQMDKFAGADNWLKKAGYEIYRNLDVREHKIPQSRAESRIVTAMRTNDTSALSMEEKAFKAKLNDHFRDLLIRLNDAGIPVASVTDATNPNYLPQRFNLEWIRANRDTAIEKLGNWFEKDRADPVAKSKAKEDAARVINEAINREELVGIVDSTSSTYAQAFGDKLHQRKLHIVGKDWDDLEMLFDSNLRSLTTAYTDAAIRRIEWAERFGVRGHGAATYTDIADRGAEAAMDALMGKVSGMKTVYSRVGAESDLVGDYASRAAEAEVEAVSTLFSATTADPTTAARIVKQVMDTLDTNKDEATRAGLADMLVQYHADNKGTGTQHFKKRAEAIVNGLADFGEDGKTVAKHEVEFMRKMVGVLGGRPAYTIDANQGLRDAAGAMKMFNSVTLLSGAVLGSLADPAMSLLRSGSVKDWLSGMTKATKLAMSDQAHVDAMMRIGVNMESVLNENITHVSGGLPGRISNAFFNANMLTPWTNAQRQVAAMVGFESIRSNQIIVQRERLAGNTDSWKFRKSMKYLRQLGLGELLESEKLADFPSAVENQKVAAAIHKFTNEAVFQPNRLDMPLWTQDPIASIFWQFKSYPTMMGRLAKKNFLDAVSFEKGNVFDKLKGQDVGKYDGDPMGLVYLLSIGAAFGAGSIAVKDTVFGRNKDAGEGNEHSPRSMTLSKIIQEFGFKDFDMNSPGADVVAGTLAHGLLGIGALGFLGDLMYQSAKSVDNGSYGRERIMSQIAGPTMGTFSDTIQVVDGVRMAFKNEDEEFGTSQERNAVRKVVKRVPFAGGMDPWVETFVNSTAGPLENPPQEGF